LATVSSSLGQASRISGRVLDQTGSVLSDVTVDLIVLGTEHTATTDNHSTASSRPV
jgi:hypothetical protein